MAVVADGDGKTVNSVILAKGAPIPSDQTCPFTLANPGQTDANIEVLQGKDRAQREECLRLGQFELTGMAPIFDRPHRVEIRLKIDHHGMLNANAYDPATGVNADVSIDYGKTKGGTQNDRPN